MLSFTKIAYEEGSADLIKAERNKLLAESDWTQLKDVNAGLAWEEYRQALRDVPQQLEYPLFVMWPTKPE